MPTPAASISAHRLRAHCAVPEGDCNARFQSWLDRIVMLSIVLPCKQQSDPAPVAERRFPAVALSGTCLPAEQQSVVGAIASVQNKVRTQERSAESICRRLGDAPKSTCTQRLQSEGAWETASTTHPTAIHGSGKDYSSSGEQLGHVHQGP